MERIIFARTEGLKETLPSFCPGCGHGILMRVVAEVVVEMGLREKTIGIAPVGCAVTAYDYWNFDVTEAAHGRPPAVATGIKRVLPDRLVFTYQGDGDLAAIGTAEIIHAANRGENITTIFVNNAVYGMTRGQMAPTTMLGQKTTTTISGRDPKIHGYPIRVCELLAVLEGTTYIERIALIDPPSVQKIKRAIRKGFECQLAEKGFSLIEVLSPCPVNWGLEPIEALNFIKEKMVSTFPPGVIKDNFTKNS
ncbi:MAG: thiamine pyrophosphate-dependent enzyme [Candidatus Omnitrophota bacterium]